jgi:hypothetical protein
VGCGSDSTECRWRVRREDRIISTPFLRYAVFPQVSETLFTLALLFYDDALPQLTQLLMLATLAIVLK